MSVVEVLFQKVHHIKNEEYFLQVITYLPTEAFPELLPQLKIMSQYKTMITDLSRYVNVYKTDQSGATL